MPRATFAGVTFDLLLDGLQDTHEGMTTVREMPRAGTTAYVDLGGPLLHRRTVTIQVDNEADYLTLAALPGTAGASGTLPTAEGDARTPSCSPSPAPGAGARAPSCCRTEWVYR